MPGGEPEAVAEEELSYDGAEADDEGLFGEVEPIGDGVEVEPEEPSEPEPPKKVLKIVKKRKIVIKKK
jgi:hypothetical protein